MTYRFDGYVVSTDLLRSLGDQIHDPNFCSDTFEGALLDEWDDTSDDETLRLQVFGPHFDEEALAASLDLCAAVAAMNKGYIL